MQGGEENTENHRKLFSLFSPKMPRQPRQVVAKHCVPWGLLYFIMRPQKSQLSGDCLDLKHLLQVKLQNMRALELPVSREASRLPRSHPGRGWPWQANTWDEQRGSQMVQVPIP